VPADVHGILLLDKPLGLTSAGAVARIKYLFQARKAGHTGSLDPLATGMLPICFGEATKFGALMLNADKTYRVTVRLGERTPSADLESAVIERRELPPFPASQMEKALEEFPRDYLQVPPMHSALKQNGKPLYEYARAGETRERAPRGIRILSLRLIEWRCPDLCFDVQCTKGASIRVLAEDLAARLDTIGHLTSLRRLGVAPFSDAPQWTLKALESMSRDERRALLMPVDAALSDWPIVDLAAEGAQAFLEGRTIDVPRAAPGKVRIYAPGLGFLGLGAVEAAGRLVPLRLISALTNRA
jgi:tRNA pseudouridine55 synthase